MRSPMRKSIVCFCLSLLIGCGSSKNGGGDAGSGGTPDPGNTTPGTGGAVPGTGGTTPGSEVVLADPCPSFDTSPTVTGALFAESPAGISGIVASRKQPGVYYIHQDRDKILYAVDGTGNLLGQWTVTSSERFFFLYNWEGISIQSVDGKPDRIWIADTGNNCVREEEGCDPRTDIRILSVEEPTIDPAAVVNGTVQVLDDLTFTYPDGLNDSEGSAIDPSTGDLYVFSKEQESPTKIYRASAPLASGVLELVASFDAANANGADFSPSGRELVVRDYGKLYYWALPGGGTWAETLRDPPSASQRLKYTQGYYSEAIAFAADESGVFAVSERKEDNPAPSPVEFYPKTCD